MYLYFRGETIHPSFVIHHDDNRETHYRYRYRYRTTGSVVSCNRDTDPLGHSPIGNRNPAHCASQSSDRSSYPIHLAHFQSLSPDTVHEIQMVIQAT